MSKTEKTLRRIMAGTADANIPFDDLCHVLRDLGFTKRVRGSHHIFARRDVEEIVKLQPRRGKAKPYQVRRIRELIARYRLGGD
jgi:predicted RNA binding protein YcfA (HicA-like mRNA interferase family)